MGSTDDNGDVPGPRAVGAVAFGVVMIDRRPADSGAPAPLFAGPGAGTITGFAAAASRAPNRSSILL